MVYNKFQDRINVVYLLLTIQHVPFAHVAQHLMFQPIANVHLQEILVHEVQEFFDT